MADLLVKWAGAGSAQRLLDPSAGGGVFLDSALSAKSTERNGAQGEIYGVEIDKPAAKLLRRRLGSFAHVVEADFFSCTQAEIGTFDAIVGNPPYIRHHQLAPETRLLARERAAEAGVRLNDQSDAWAYFVVHALQLLEPHGRLALVLPGSILHAAYATPVLESVSAANGGAALTRIQTLLFEEAQERTVVLTVDRGAKDTPLGYREVADVEGLEQVLDQDIKPMSKVRTRRFVERRDERMLGLLPRATQKAWKAAATHPDVASLESVATLRIGVVTGANAFFVRPQSEIETLLRGSRTAAFPSIVSRSGWLEGLRWTQTDVERYAAKPSSLLALDADHIPNSALAKNIKEAESDGIAERSHCAKREPWWVLTDLDAPDLFLPYMGGSPPRLVVNEARSLCTNAIHRAKLKRGVDPLSIALSSWTSMYRLGAELFGRQYAGGILKFEIGEAARLPVVNRRVQKRYLAAAEKLIQQGDVDAVGEYADRILLEEALGFSPDVVVALRKGATMLARRRKTR